jgi:HAD superfamily hydrolase (TIGR01490 family)
VNATEPRAAAFFDFDRTLVDTDGGVLFGRELIRIYRRRVLHDRPGTLGWVTRVVGYHLRMGLLLLWSLVARLLYYLRIIKRSSLVAIAYRGMRGLSIDELRLLAHDFTDEVLRHRMFPEALRLMQWHKQQGHLVIIATTNMRLLVDHMKRHAPVDDVIGTDLLEQEGRVTGRIRGPTYGVEKAEAIRRYAHERNISLPRSHAYTDHYSDHFILPLVGHPHVVNPRWRMRRMAKRRHWDVLRFKAPLLSAAGGRGFG